MIGEFDAVFVMRYTLLAVYRIKVYDKQTVILVGERCPVGLDSRLRARLRRAGDTRILAA
jgi:hypothetical protein